MVEPDLGVLLYTGSDAQRGVMYGVAMRENWETVKGDAGCMRKEEVTLG